MRLLEQKDGRWYWEGKLIDPAQLQDYRRMHSLSSSLKDSRAYRFEPVAIVRRPATATPHIEPRIAPVPVPGWNQRDQPAS